MVHVLDPRPVRVPGREVPSRRDGPERALLRGLYEQFRTAVGQVPDDPRAAEVVRLLHRERPDAAERWRCRAVADFRPTTVRTEEAELLAFALLRPVADPGVLVLTARRHPGT